MTEGKNVKGVKIMKRQTNEDCCALNKSSYTRSFILMSEFEWIACNLILDCYRANITDETWINLSWKRIQYLDFFVPFQNTLAEAILNH